MIKHQKVNIKFSPRTDLILPEYGRNIQQMVEYAVAIEDREQRTKCANSIINIMGNMFPYLRDVDGFKFKLWDHLAIMSRFQLDIDYPFDVIRQENLALKPNKINYSSKKMRYMHYGAIIEKFIDIASNIENEEVRNSTLISIANFMKKSLISWNNKYINDDKKIFNDLRELSKGKISINPDDFQLLAPEEFLRVKKRTNQNNSNNRRRGKKKEFRN